MAQQHNTGPPRPEKNTLISFPVWWYPMADKNAGPRTAFVTGPAMKHRENVLTLTIWEENSDRPRLERNVRHIDDPKLKQIATLKEVGAWDYPEWFVRLTRMVDEAVRRNKAK